jgi:hypothetical protein
LPDAACSCIGSTFAFGDYFEEMTNTASAERKGGVATYVMTARASSASAIHAHCGDFDFMI